MKKEYTVKENDTFKVCKGPDYNYFFNKETGFFARWGKEEKDDPAYAPAPEILDIEISTICNGMGTPCKFCYKSNTKNGRHMSFETFKDIFAKTCKHILIEMNDGDIIRLGLDEEVELDGIIIKARELLQQ